MADQFAAEEWLRNEGLTDENGLFIEWPMWELYGDASNAEDMADEIKMYEAEAEMKRAYERNLSLYGSSDKRTILSRINAIEAEDVTDASKVWEMFNSDLPQLRKFHSIAVTNGTSADGDDVTLLIYSLRIILSLFRHDKDAAYTHESVKCVLDEILPQCEMIPPTQSAKIRSLLKSIHSSFLVASDQEMAWNVLRVAISLCRAANARNEEGELLLTEAKYNLLIGNKGRADHLALLSWHMYLEFNPNAHNSGFAADLVPKRILAVHYREFDHLRPQMEAIYSMAIKSRN